MDQNNFSFEFANFINYETILCSFFPNTKVVNAACVGTHFGGNDTIFFHLFDGTDTKENLQPGVKFSLNFSECFLDYVIAALKGWNQGIKEPEFDIDTYSTIVPYPIMKSAWLVLGCEVTSIGPFPFEVCKRRQSPNVQATIFEKKIIRPIRIFNNRAFNLAVESLVIATRLPFIDRFSAEYNKNLQLYKDIKQKIRQWHDMDRFSDGFEVIDNFMIKNGMKAEDIFSF